MNPSPLRPRAHLFVCTNARSADDPLASGCGADGPAVYTALRQHITTAGLARDIWITRTNCLGHCPRHGCSVALYPQNLHFIDVTEHDAPALAQRAMENRRTP